MAYRSKKEERQVAAARSGLVVDMVQQFADKYAFVRELVQNGIDAGSTAVSMRARYIGGEAVFSLRDDGEGMTREIIEGPLLTLFNSAKDEDDTKIGKYGVGFVSVFAIEPDEVIVETWRAEGSWSLSVRPDHTYELAHGSERDGSGTIVSLRKRMSRESFRDHAGEVAAALRRWCKHARLPIHWYLEEEGADTRHHRMDTPLAVDTKVAVEAELDGMRIVVGAGFGSFVGFYNHGLTLFEAASMSNPGFSGIQFKVDAAALSHTLSRDNVRHDEAYHLALRRVLELKDGALRRRVIERLAECAASPDLVEHEELVRVACVPTLSIAADEMTVPLCDAVNGERVALADTLVDDDLAFYETEPTPITRALAVRGRAVLLAGWPLATLEALATKIGVAIHPAHAAFTLLTPYTGGSAKKRKRADAALLRGLSELLESAGGDVDEVALVRATGAPPKRAGIRVANAKVPQLVAAEERSRFILRKPRALMLPVGNAMVKAARRLARENPAAAAHLLARYLLVEERGELSRGDSDRLLGAVR